MAFTIKQAVLATDSCCHSRTLDNTVIEKTHKLATTQQVLAIDTHSQIFHT